MSRSAIGLEVAKISSVDLEQKVGEHGLELPEFAAKRLLVIGAPRSGTQFFTGVLKNFGMRVNHERMGEDGIVHSGWMPPGGNTRFKGYTREKFSFDRILHLVRHPLLVIDSLSREGPGFPNFWEMQEKHSGIHLSDNHTDLEGLARFWIYWTSGAKQQSDYQVRLEDIQHFGQPENVGENVDKKIKLAWSDVGDAEEALKKHAERFYYG
jgi:hypothetical protein